MKKRDEERAMLRRVVLCLIDCADDLEAVVTAHYPDRDRYECERTRYERDMRMVMGARRVVADALTLMHGIETLPEGAREKEGKG